MGSGKPILHKGSENMRFVSLWLAVKQALQDCSSNIGPFEHHKVFRAPQDTFQKHKRGKETSIRLRTAHGNGQLPDYAGYIQSPRCSFSSRWRSSAAHQKRFTYSLRESISRKRSSEEMTMGRGVLRLCAWFLEDVFIDAAKQTFYAIVPNGLA